MSVLLTTSLPAIAAVIPGAMEATGRFAMPVAVLLPARNGASVRRAGTELFTGGAFALHAGCRLLTEASHAFILLHVSPARSTAHEIRPAQASGSPTRSTAMIPGLAGVLVLLPDDAGLFLPRKAARHRMAVAAGEFRACKRSVTR